MKKRRFTHTEKSILYQLDKNSRASFRKIGKTIHKSEQNVSYSVNSLLRKGAIKKFCTLIDYSRFSVISFRVFFRINYINQAKFKELTDFLIRHPNTMWVALCGGRYDLVCTFGAHNPSQFNKLFRKIMAEFSKQIQNYEILTTVVIRILPRKYLIKQRKTHPDIIFMGGDRKPYDLPEKDMHLLSEISEDARKSSIDIGKKISCNPRTVINRIKILKDMEVIKGFKTFIDFSETKYMVKMLLVRYHNISVEDEERLVSYLCTHPHVQCVTKTLGEWDLEIRIESEDEREFRRTEREIREKFSEMIQRTETVPVYNEFKNVSFPRFLVSE